MNKKNKKFLLKIVRTIILILIILALIYAFWYSYKEGYIKKYILGDKPRVIEEGYGYGCEEPEPGTPDPCGGS